MLPPEPTVLQMRQGFQDAQQSIAGPVAPLGEFSVGWYGARVSDERGCFALVDKQGPLLARIGDFLKVSVGDRSVKVYVIGAYQDLLTDLALTRRAYMQIALLSDDPVSANVGVIG